MSRRLAALVTVFAALLLAGPDSAAASTAALNAGTLEVNGAGTEQNNLTITSDGVNFTIAESGSGVTLTPGASCLASATPNQVLCPAATVASMTVNGGDGNDLLTNNSSTGGTLNGGNGWDTLAGTGSNALVGGGDIDTASYATRTTPVTASFDATANDGEAGELDNVSDDVEIVSSGSAIDTLTGNAGANAFDGGAGADHIFGAGGNDYILYFGRSAPLSVSFDGVDNDGASGENDDLNDIESVVGGSGNDTFLGGSAANTFMGSGGSDTVSYADHTAAVTADLDGTADDGATGEGDSIATDVENITGGTGADTLTGSSAANTLKGGAGNDTLDGATGADVLEGGDDTDTVTYASRTAAVTVTVDGAAGDGEATENDNVQADVENVVGGAGQDQLTGDGDANRLDGGPEADQLNGLGGDDVLDGGLGADELAGGDATDRVTYASRTAAVTADPDGVADDGEAGEGDDVHADVENLTGGSGADQLTGTTAVNSLIGGGGADTLTGGSGQDVLDGGDGSDDVQARDSVVDQVTCGADADAVTGDRGDSVNADCEDVDVPALPAAPKQPTPPVAEEPEEEPQTEEEKLAELVQEAKEVLRKFAISKKPVKVTGRIAVIDVACPKVAEANCRGSVAIELLSGSAKPKNDKASASRRSRRRRVLGRGRFVVPPGKAKTVKVKISRNGRHRLLRRKKRRCRISVSLRGGDGKVRTKMRNVTLKVKASRRSRGRRRR